MKNQLLIHEIASQISQRFTPKAPDIKKVLLLSPLFAAEAEDGVPLTSRWTQAIDTLLEKEYIERVEGSSDTFAYVAY
jgi:cullin 1